MRRIGEPSEVEILRASARRAKADIRTSVPGVVVDYDATKQRVTVKSAVFIPDASGIPQELPQLSEVRVSWLRGGGYFAACPLVAGDVGLLVFCEADFTPWLATGEIGEPLNVRTHGLNAWFIPGGCVDGNELANAPTDHMVIGKDGGPLIRVKGTGIELGASVTDYVAMAQKVLTELTTLNSGISALTTWAGTHMHPTAGTGPPSPPAVAPPSPPAAPASVAATKVKAQ